MEYFSSIFQDGTYNCVSASMLYSMILDNLNIPYKVQASSNHVYLVANPGENSIVIETTNPMFENAVFTGEFKRQYVNHLKESKLISKEDIDLLVHLSRFNSKCKNQEIKNEVGFTYNIQMYEQNRNTVNGEKYLENALLLKSNHKAAINQFNFLIRMKLEKINDYNVLLDSLDSFEKKYSFDFVKPVLEEYKMKAYLRTAKEYFQKNKITSGNKYLLLFEQYCKLPIDNPYLENDIENTYRSAALYYYYRKNKKKTKEYVERGLKYVPSSKLLKSLR